MDIAHRRRCEVHETLLPVLAEFYGDKVRVVEVKDADEGGVVYGFPLSKAFVHVGAVACSERSASVAVHVQLGHCYVGYRRALRWLASNRAGNSIAISAHELQIAARDLWVSSNRVTLPGDADGIREQLRDIGVELTKITAGMAWFPQLLDGARLAEFEEKLKAYPNGAIAAMLVEPRTFAEWVGENKAEAMENCGPFPVDVYGWLGRWQEQLTFLDKHYSQLPAENQNADRETYLFYRLRALSLLNRPREVLAVCDELENHSADWKAAIHAVVPRMRALIGLGQYEESLDLAKPAVYDAEPRVWYYRAEALAMLEQHEEAHECFQRYETMVGPDIIARQQIRRLLPQDWRPNEETTA